MRKLLSALLLTATLFGPAALAAPTAVDTFLGPILGNPADAAAIKVRCDAYIAEIDRRQTQLETERGAATLTRSLQRFDDIANILIAASGEAGLYRETGADAARRDAGATCEVRIASAASKLSLSRPVYDRLKLIDARGAEASTRLYLKRTLEGFDRAGVSRSAADRAQIQALQDKIAAAGTAFEGNIAKGQRTFTARAGELDGMPADYIAAHKPGADGVITITTDYPDYLPIMSYAKSEALRKRAYFAYNARAWPENDIQLRVLLNLRQQLATKLGRPDFATLALEDKMLDTPAKVETLLTDMAAIARPASARDYARKLAALHQADPQATTIPPWTNAVLTQQVLRDSFAYDTQESRKYFAFNNVERGILQLTSDIFGVQFRKWDTPVWSAQVTAYEMLEQGKVIGRFYFDAHPRPGKYQHANQITLRNGIAGRAVPLSVLVMNLPAGDHATGLMQHDDVVTFLHEFGHLLHNTFASGNRWAGQAGVTTEWDFVEAPSQMLENWVFDFDTLKSFAVDAQGRTIPRALVEKMNKARDFDLGMGDMRQLALSNISLRYHQAAAPDDLFAAYRQYDQVYNPLVMPDGTHGYDSFPHLAGYSAYYYTYRWSKVIADDMFTRFQREGLRNRATASAYRRLVLAPGGSKPAAMLVSDFLGRPISLDAYRAEVALDR